MSLLIDHTSCMATGSLEDFARFKTERGNVMQTLLLPWDITLNRQVGSPAAETGPLFLALLPLGLMLGSPRHRSFDRSWFEKPTVILASFAFAYGLSWLLFAKQVPWYGYPGLALLALLAARVMEYSDSQPFLRRCLFIVLILGLIGNTLQQMEFSGQSGQIRSAGGLIDRLDYLETSFPSYLTVTEILNFNPTDRVYITGSRLLYGIRDNDRRALLDTRLDNFNCLANEDDPETTLAAMRSLRVRYILFSRSLLQELTGDYPSTLREKVVRFTDFSGQHLSIVWGSADYMLFEVPRDSK
jgi:hypothetical protein